MKYTLRGEPIVKSAAYSAFCLAILLFSYSFLPSLGIFRNVPTLLVAAVSALAFFEGVRYASFFALIFSVIETLILGTNTLLFPLFYVALALLTCWLFESFFVKNFLFWLSYTAAGLLAHAILSLFAPVGNWGVSAVEILVDKTLPSLAMSAVLSLLIFPAVGFIKRKTDKK